MPDTAFFFSEKFLAHLGPEGHPERPERLAAIRDRLKETGQINDLQRPPFDPAAPEQLALVHQAAYLEMLAAAGTDGLAFLDGDTYVTPESFAAAALAAGAGIAAADLVLSGRARNAFCAVRPPGHHALPAQGMGFCLVNNVAVAAAHLRRRPGIERVLIIDWDVHHGNGTQAIFYTDPAVFYFSVHQSPHFPGSGSAGETGEGPGLGTTRNVPLPAHSGDAEYQRVFQEVLRPEADGFKPDFILLSAGFDAHADDPLSQMAVSEAGFAELTRVVRELAAAHCGGRLVSFLEGGYDLGSLSRAVGAHLRVLSEG